MTSSIPPSAVKATLLVLALAATIQFTVSASLPPTTRSSRDETDADFWVPFPIEIGNFHYSAHPLKTKDAFAYSEQEEKFNSSLETQFYDTESGSNASLYQDVKVSLSGNDFDLIDSTLEYNKEQGPRIAHRRKRRSLAKLGELHCEGEEYPLVTIPAGAFVQIMSPGYPRAYSNSTRCGWKFMSDPDRVIRVICPVFQLGRGDFTLLTDYTNPKSLRFDYNTVMKNVTVASNKLFLGFKSDAGEEGKGFLCLVVSLPLTLPVESESPVENVTTLTDLEVSDFKKRLVEPSIVQANTTTIRNVFEQVSAATVSELPVTAVPTLSSQFLLSSGDRPSSHTVTIEEYLLALIRRTEKATIKSNTVRGVSST